MQIQLRTTDVVRRMTDRFELITPEWPHHKRLAALAAMYGYPSWEALVASCCEDAQHFTFDQDLPSDEFRQARWLDMAQQVANQFGLYLPHALDLVRMVHPTSAIGRPLSVWYEPNNTFDRALLEDRDLWWVSIREEGHPFIPPGFILGQAIRVADVAEARLSRQSLPPLTREKIWVLLPVNHKTARFGHTYCHRGEFLEIAPIPTADAIRNAKKGEHYLKEFFENAYPQQSQEQNTLLMYQWKLALKALHKAAGLPENSKRRWVSITVSSRESIGQAWYWPLKLQSMEQEIIEATKQYALNVNAEVLEEFDGNPGCIKGNWPTNLLV